MGDRRRRSMAMQMAQYQAKIEIEDAELFNAEAELVKSFMQYEYHDESSYRDSVTESSFVQRDRKECDERPRFPAHNSRKGVLKVNAATMSLDSHIERVLWTPDQIAARVSDLAAQISADFSLSSLSSLSQPPALVGVATGAFLFLADLARQIPLPVTVDFIRAESYGSGTQSNGAPTISFDLKVDVTGRHVVLVEDIVDTGSTIERLIAHMESKGASSVSVCTFLDKPSRRKVHFQLLSNGKFYRGFECPDYFVVGYGMDFDERYRNLPYIGVLKAELYK